MRTNFRNALAVFVLLTLCFAGQLRAEAKQPVKMKAVGGRGQDDPVRRVNTYHQNSKSHFMRT